MELYNSDCLLQLDKLEENSIDSCVCDPPYGINFLNNNWDDGIAFNKKTWEKVLRVLKPGSQLLAFGSTRTYHRLVCAVEDAGFEIRDTLSWIYSSGFPKSNNIGLSIDKMKGDAKEWQGWGTNLKPAQELIVLARKPISEKTIAKNVLKWGTGGINIDESRIPTDEEIEIRITNPNANMFFNKNGKAENTGSYTNNKGRYPANVLFDCICDKVEVIKTDKKNVMTKIDKSTGSWFFNGSKEEWEGIMNYNDDTIIHTNPDCPCYILDKQSGGASRFFYCSKVTKKEREAGLTEDIQSERNIGACRCTKCNRLNISGEKTRCNCKEPDFVLKHVKNNHPCVKPVKLLEYLAKLITPKGGTILDIFMGSGSQGIAANNLGYNFIGIEKDEHYFSIAKKRIAYWKEVKEKEQEKNFDIFQK